MAAFARHLSQDLYVPQQKFVLVFLSGMLASASPMLSKIGGAMAAPGGSDNQHRDFETRERYLSRNINSSRLDMGALVERYHQTLKPFLHRKDGEGVTISVDGTDYRKENARPHRARGMEGATCVRDGSRSRSAEPELRMGFPGVTIEATLPDGNQIPLAHWLYSRDMDDPLLKTPFRSDALTTIAIITRVAGNVGSRAWWTFDRGYDDSAFYAELDRMKVRWLVRANFTGVSARRELKLTNGTIMPLNLVAERLPLPYTRVLPERGGALTIRMGLAKVWIKTGAGTATWSAQARTLLVAEFNGAKNRFVAFASEWLSDKQDVAEMLRSEYRKRWSVETTHRHVKDSRGWGFRIEDFRVLKLVGIQRVVLFGMLASGFMALLREAHPKQAEQLAKAAWVRGKVLDIRYRLTQTIGAALRPWLRRKVAEHAPRRRRTRTLSPEVELARLRRRRDNAKHVAAAMERRIQALMFDSP